jgi:hypothetical protein
MLPMTQRASNTKHTRTKRAHSRTRPLRHPPRPTPPTFQSGSEGCYNREVHTRDHRATIAQTRALRRSARVSPSLLKALTRARFLVGRGESHTRAHRALRGYLDQEKKKMSGRFYSPQIRT